MSNLGSEVSLSRLALIVLARLSSPTPPGPQELGEAVQAFVLPAESLPRAREIALEVLARIIPERRSWPADRERWCRDLSRVSPVA